MNTQGEMDGLLRVRERKQEILYAVAILRWPECSPSLDVMVEGSLTL